MPDQSNEPPMARIRPIRKSDNDCVAAIIREVMSEFECTGIGYSCHDPEVDAMYQAYSNCRSVFYVIESAGEVLGCGGIAPLAGADDDMTCELRKMYFRMQLRGLGLGRKLLSHCLSEAWNLGFSKCYIESVERMTTALSLYRKSGFERLDAPLGNTGHSTCDVFLVRGLSEADVIGSKSLSCKQKQR